jgi:hypothetical protein
MLHTIKLSPYHRNFSPNCALARRALVAPNRRSSEYLQEFVESEIEKWAGVIKAVGVAAQ